VIWYALFFAVGGYWILSGAWLIVSGLLDLIRIALFGYPGDRYRDD
jgi:hypothetical protein